MSRVLTFTRTFPAYHPKAGQPTYFVEKLWKYVWDAEKSSMNPLNGYFQYYDEAFPCAYNDPLENIHKHEPKLHTIRAGNRWKVGEKFSPRVWSGKPYNSKQIIIAPDIEVKKVWDFEIRIIELPGMERPVGGLYINNEMVFGSKHFEVAKNDGLEYTDFVDWFANGKKPKPFSGQIICWGDVEY